MACQRTRFLQSTLILTLFCSITSGAIYYQDSFDSGTFDSQVYQAMGGASLEVLGFCDDRTTCDPMGTPCADGSMCNFKLVVHLTSLTSSGVRINLDNVPTPGPGVGSPACLRMAQDIDPVQFPPGSTWRHTIVMVNENDPADITGMQLQALRPAWNRCKYTLTNRTSGATQEALVFTPTQGDTTKFSCLEAKDVVFDWLPDKACEFSGAPCTTDADCNGDGSCKPQIQAEVTSREAQAVLDEFECLFQKPSCLDHGGTGDNAFRITAWEVTKGEDNRHD